MRTTKLITNILITLLSIYPLFTIFTMEGEIYASKGSYIGGLAQLAFWILVLIIISIYFVEKINIYVVSIISILSIILNLILVTNFLNINLLQPANPRQIYAYLVTSIGISILYVGCKIIYSGKPHSNKINSYIPIILTIVLGIVDLILL